MDADPSAVPGVAVVVRNTMLEFVVSDEETGTELKPSKERRDSSVSGSTTDSSAKERWSDVSDDDSSAWGSESDSSQSRTTLLLKQLPAEYTRSRLTAMLDQNGFQGLYNFVYVPLDLHTRAAFGFAFVNFETPTCALQAMSKLAVWMDVQWSAQQGLETQIERYRNSPIMHDSVHDDFRPQLFAAGLRQPFPRPTKELEPPAQESRAEKRAAYKARKAARRQAARRGSDRLLGEKDEHSA
jgi:hypothetical protein